MSSMGQKRTSIFVVAALVLASFAPTTVIAADQVPFGSLPAAVDATPKRVMRVEVSAYTSRPQETDATPFVTASGTRVRDGVIAANTLRFGTRVRIPELYGDKVFIVEDRMNPRYGRHVDIWMEDLMAAKALGRRQVEIHVF